MGVPYKLPRGTRAALDTLAAANGLTPYQSYFLTDENRLVVATAVNTYIDMAAPKLGIHCAGKPSASEVIGGGIAPAAFTITPANCLLKALVAATAEAIFIIKKGGIQIGTATFAAAATAATFDFTQTEIAEDDHVTMHAPASADATLANLSGLIR